MTGDSRHSAGGEELVRQQVITQEDLDAARKRERETGTPWYRQLLQSRKLGFDTLNDILHYEFHPSSVRQSHSTLGETLVRQGTLTAKQLDEALSIQKRNGRLLGSILLENEFVDPEAIARALSEQYGIEYVDLTTPSEASALDRVPESMAKQKEFIPLGIEGDVLSVLIAGPEAPGRLKDVGVLLGLRIVPYITAVADIRAEIGGRYAGGRVVDGKTRLKMKSRSGAPTPTVTKVASVAEAPATKSSAPSKRASKTKAETPSGSSSPKGKGKSRGKVEEEKVVANESGVKGKESRFDDIARESQGVPVVKLVSTIIEGAVNSGATDVHLDPQEPEMRVRYRIDGVLHDVMSIPEEIENAVVSRIKIMADIDITESRHPQDGHISMEIADGEFDIRVATLPTFLGERVVLRLLDQTSVLSGIRDLGLEKDDAEKLTRAIEQPYGMILVTGPTGSGKTTTLYSCLNQKNVMTESIVTLEDPVEYQLSGINQVQIENDIDLSFANVLRASLRQDIDVLLVGEIRDPETARIAIRAAMTGHLVFSTLHTNDAPEAIATLRNMDIPSYLISSALTAVLAQRLVRRICDDCKTSFTPTKSLLKSLLLPESTKKLYRGKGCENCYHTGTHGRTGIFEILDMTKEVRTLIAAEQPTEKVAKAAKLKTMADRCRQKVKDGMVTPEEFLRVIRT